MCVYLIDYENVGIKGLNGIGQLSENDKVYIFYGKNAGSVSFETLEQIINSPAKVNCLRALKSAKNYLDFQLVTFSGFLVAHLDDKNYKIISKDTGFDAVVDFWNARQDSTGGVKFSRQETIVPNTNQEKQIQIGMKKNDKKANVKTSDRFNRQKSQNHVQIKPAETAVRTERAEDKAELKEVVNTSAEPVAKSDSLEKEAVEKKAESVFVREDKMNDEMPDLSEQKEVAPVKNNSDEKNEKKKIQPKTNGKLSESFRKKIREKVKSENLKSGTYTSIYNCVLKSESKQQLHTNLVKALKMEKGAAVYKLIVPVFEEIHKAES